MHALSCRFDFEALNCEISKIIPCPTEMAPERSELCLPDEKVMVRNGADTPHPFQFCFGTSFPVPPESKQHLRSMPSQGPHIPAKEFK